uniref:Presenilin n=1 Tax=Globodera rostochiensis TaxID=31243 RepID=A0A914H2R9_GLORO
MDLDTNCLLTAVAQSCIAFTTFFNRNDHIVASLAPSTELTRNTQKMLYGDTDASLCIVLALSLAFLASECVLHLSIVQSPQLLQMYCLSAHTVACLCLLKFIVDAHPVHHFCSKNFRPSFKQPNTSQRHKSASDARVAALVVDARDGATTNNNSNRDDDDGTDEIDDDLKYGASHVVNLFVPVSLCMAFVVLSLKSSGFYSMKNKFYLPYTPFHSDTKNTGTLLIQAIGNALVMLIFVVLTTVVVVVLFYYRFYKLIRGWVVICTFSLLTLFSFSFVFELFKHYNIQLDYLSFSIVLWNWSLLGMVCMHWKGPLKLQQFYLVVVCALMALVFIKYMPDWSVWTVLVMLSIWDLVAVLCPKGPLRVLVETTQDRNEAILPALLYSSTVLYTIYGSAVGAAAGAGAGGNDGNNNGDDQQQPPCAAGFSSESGPELARLNSSTTDALLSSSSSSSSTTTGTTVAHRRLAGRSTDTSDDSANTLHTTIGLTNGGSVGESRSTRTGLSPGQQHHRRASTAPRTSRSARPPRRPASKRGVQSRTGNAAKVMPPEEELGVKLGLGDFIFYSVLLGKASSYGDWNVTIACYVVILVGLACTLMLLALCRKALPALPISIFGGIIFFFATRWMITPFMDCVSGHQISL